MKWFKFYGQDYLSDPKILALSACERSCWITLLSYGSINDNGMITFLDEEQLMAQSGISPMHDEWDNTKGVLEKLKKLKMIEFDNEMITILNWKKRQETSLTPYERVKRYREKKRNDNADDNAKITTDKNRIDKNRIISPADKSAEEFPLKEKKEPPANKPAWDFNTTLNSWLTGKNKAYQLIGEFFKGKKLVFNTSEQMQVAAKRHLRAAMQLAVFTDEQIDEAMGKIKQNSTLKNEWTLETIIKYITK